MKKLIFMFACLSVMALTGCKKDENKTPESLVGTVWFSENLALNESGTLSFQETTFNMIFKSQEDGKPVEQTVTGKYTYAGSNVTLTPDKAGAPAISATVDGDVLTLKDGGDIVIFNRK